MGFIPTVSVEYLGVELTFSISRHLEIFEPTSGGDQIARVGAIAIAFAFGTGFSPGRSNEGIKLLAHDQFSPRAHGALSQRAQMLVKFLLLRQEWGRTFPL